MSGNNDFEYLSIPEIKEFIQKLADELVKYFVQPNKGENKMSMSPNSGHMATLRSTQISLWKTSYARKSLYAMLLDQE